MIHFQSFLITPPVTIRLSLIICEMAMKAQFAANIYKNLHLEDKPLNFLHQSTQKVPRNRVKGSPFSIA